MSSAAAAAFPELARAVPFHGRQVPAPDVPKTNAPLLLHYVQLDTRANEGQPACEAALKANKKVYKTYTHPGVDHGFRSDSAPRHDKAAVDLAWGRTLAWFNKYLQQKIIDYLVLITNYLNNDTT